MASAVRFDPEDARALIEEHAHLEGPLLPILHALQARFGAVGEEAVRLVSAALNLSRAEVHGVVSFYHDFRAEPDGRRHLKVCRAEACQANGSDGVAASFEEALGISFGETTDDGQVTLEACYCLGLCAIGPAAMLDGRIVARLDEARAQALAVEARL